MSLALAVGLLLAAPAGEAATFELLGRNEAGALVFSRPTDGARVVWVEAGEFLQPRYAPRRSDPIERRTRTLPGYAIDETEVTNERFARFLNARGSAVDDRGRPLVRSVADGLVEVDGVWRPEAGVERLPALGVTGHGALAYAEWVGGALPTLAEWQKAAGGVEGRVWPWGDAPPEARHANSRAFAPDRPMVVGCHPDGASPYGVFDLAGNVYERVFAPGRDAPVVIRGGSWCSPHPLNLRTLDMCVQAMGAADRTVGFRCVVRSGAGLPADPEAHAALAASEAGARDASRPPATDLAREEAPRPRLRLARTWEAARAEARARNVPILVSLHYDTCGQCDRTKVGVFEDPRFVERMNERAVVVVGQFSHDAEGEPHRSGEGGACPLLPGLTCDEHFDLWFELFERVGGFSISPGNFLVDPRVGDDGYVTDRVLVGERAFPKGGGGVDVFLERLDQAQAALGEGIPFSAWREVREF
ncbi:MAG: formylglycine-generating enzyme family protein [Planctomycetota bacterium JB042]